MFFSVITPVDGLAQGAAHQRLHGPYADHQWLWGWFPSAPGTRRDFLYRQGLTAYYVVSQRPPALRLGDWCAQTREYAPHMAEGEAFDFQLRANPAVTHGRDGKSKHHDVVMELKKTLLASKGMTRWRDWEGPDKPATQAVIHRACAHWLARSGEKRGFDVDVESLTVESYLQHREKPSQNLRFTSVDFTGRLRVTDVALFNAALFGGVGRAKAFGCGLMLIRRPAGRTMEP